MNKLNESEKIPRNYGIHILMTPSEVHILKAIGKNPGCNIRTLSELVGITPGAASQQVTRLTNRGLVTKKRGVKNEKEVFLSLTPLGEEAFNNHETVHEMIYQRIVDRIGPLRDDEINTLNRVFRAMESVYDERLREVREELSKHVTPDTSRVQKDNRS
jgi:DNA-binding MarR family transcriptional regulator